MLSERENNSIEMTLYNLEDLILYILDVSSTLTVLLKIYSPIIITFHRDDFINKYINFIFHLHLINKISGFHNFLGTHLYLYFILLSQSLIIKNSY